MPSWTKSSLMRGALLGATLVAAVSLSGCDEGDAPLFPGLSAAAADAVEITRGDSDLSFERDADGWWIALHEGRGRADDELVEDLLDLLARSRHGDIVPGGQDQLGTLGLANGGTGRIVVTSSDRPIIDVRIGSDAPGPSQVFMLPEGERGVFVSSDGLADMFRLPFDDWRDHRITSFELPDVVGLELVNRGEMMVIVPVDGRWHMTRPVDQDVDKRFVDALLFSLAELDAVGFESRRSPAACGFGEDGSEGLGSVTVRLAIGPPQSVLFGGGDGDMWYVMRPDRDDIYLLPLEFVESVFGDVTAEPPSR